MDIKTKYEKYKSKHYDKLLKVYKDERENEIRESMTPEGILLRKILGEEPPFRMEDLEKYIQKELKKVEKEYKPILKEQFDIKYKSDHNPNILGINLVKLCKDIKKSPVEIKRILLFKGGEYLGYLEGTSNSECSVEYDVTKNLVRDIIKKYPEADTMVTIHNHPNCANARPSELDDAVAKALKITGSVIGVKLYDDCIITELDFYSRMEDEMISENRILTKNLLLGE